MPSPPRLAVVISCYNYARFVGRAIRSVLDQDCDDCEVVVVDDGSTDGSWEVISASGVRAFRIANGGQRAACLFGLERTSAPFVMFLDADDELEPGALATILAKLDPEVAKLQFPLTRIDADGREIGATFPKLDAFRDRGGIARQILTTGVYTTPPTSGNVFRRDVCKLLGSATYDQAVDGVILFAAPFFGDVVSVAEPLARYRIHGANDSGAGRMPDVRTVERDISRFLLRTAHLREILASRGGLELVPPEETFYLKLLRLTTEVAAGRRPSAALLAAVLSRLAQEHFPLRKKASFAAYLSLVSLLPRGTARALMAFRSRR